MIIVGAGGHSRVVMAALIRITGTVIPGRTIYWAEAVDTLVEDFHAAVKRTKSNYAHIAIGDNDARKNFLRDTPTGTMEFPFIIHPSAICDGATDQGVFVAAHAYVGAGTTVGSFTIINTKTCVDHDCVVGEFCHLAPGVTTGGRVTIGSGTFIGIGACIRDGIGIGTNCVIGMGAVVVQDVPDNTIAYGNPARPVRLAC
jgi:sugar O-acyltransferase (sialic acid O-acetyltransferase NeuD family)